MIRHLLRLRRPDWWTAGVLPRLRTAPSVVRRVTGTAVAGTTARLREWLRRGRTLAAVAGVAIVLRTMRATSWVAKRFARARREVRGVVRAIGPRRWRLIGATSATVLTAAVLSLTWLPDNTWAGTVPSSTQAVGTCHAFATISERQSFSDVRPAVPCDQPHQGETVLVGQLTGDLAGPDRMTPETSLLMTGQLCPDSAVRQYVGARPRDELYSVVGVLRLPTQREWDQGLREYRCDLVTMDPTDPVRIPALDMSLRNVLNTPAGARVRHCWVDFVTEGTCDRPHRSESVWGIATTPQWIIDFGPPASFNTAQYEQFQQWSAQTCAATVTQFLGQPVSHTRYHIEGHLSPDTKVLWCSVAFPNRQPLTSGSIARGKP